MVEQAQMERQVLAAIGRSLENIRHTGEILVVPFLVMIHRHKYTQFGHFSSR